MDQATRDTFSPPINGKLHSVKHVQTGWMDCGMKVGMEYGIIKHTSCQTYWSIICTLTLLENRTLLLNIFIIHFSHPLNKSCPGPSLLCARHCVGGLKAFFGLYLLICIIFRGVIHGDISNRLLLSVVRLDIRVAMRLNARTVDEENLDRLRIVCWTIMFRSNSLRDTKWGLECSLEHLEVLFDGLVVRKIGLTAGAGRADGVFPILIDLWVNQ